MPAATNETRSNVRKTLKKLGQDVSERLRRAEILLNVYQRTAGLDSLDDVLATIVDIAIHETTSEAGTLFLHDETTGELYSRVTQGSFKREFRIRATKGIAGNVFTNGKGQIIPDAYKDKRFDPTIDQQTGFTTRAILCAPVKTVRGDVIGVVQVLNKQIGDFTRDDLALLEAMATQASDALQSTSVIERMKKTRAQELRFLEIVSDITSEIELSALLNKVMDEATNMLSAERSTLFLNDEKTNELWSLVGGGLNTQIRISNSAGIAGAVFTSGKSVIIPYAYADLRFNPSFDKKTGFFTRSILCVPVVTKKGNMIGVTQVLNKKGGTFTEEDESRLRAFTAQVSIALENAKLFNDVQDAKNFNEGILESMSNGVITLDEEGLVTTCNDAGLKILERSHREVIHQPARDIFGDANKFVMDIVEKVGETKEIETLMDADLTIGGKSVSVNLSVHPVIYVEQKRQGTMIMLENISNEKRMKSTMSLYMDPSIASGLMDGADDILAGRNAEATVIFTDIRGFTSITEELGAQGTVSLLNEYFTIMVDCITREGGMLDKFIGDAIMAAFGTPIPHDDDEDRAVRCAIHMIQDLWKWNQERRTTGVKPLDMGVGINTDMIVSGNIGSPKRMNYTLIGDGVNLASRLESACKQYRARILISEYTVKKLKGTYRMREIDKVIVKGKTEPVSVFEVLDYHTDATFPNLPDTLNAFKNGLEEYRNRRWDKAIKSFSEARSHNPGDHLSELYIGRSNLMKSSPPPKDWDGTWVMTAK